MVVEDKGTDLVAHAEIIVRIHNGEHPLPRYESENSSGMDLRSAIDIKVLSGSTALIPTGLFIEMPEGIEGQIRPRSGIAMNYQVTVLNAPGTIDSDYRGEIKVLLINHGKDVFVVNKGDRIAQIVFTPVLRVTLQSTDSPLNETRRGVAGFGSTGRQ